MSIDQIERVEGQVMPVNTFLIRAPDGVVVIDGMLTVSDAARVRQAIDDTDRRRRRRALAGLACQPRSSQTDLAHDVTLFVLFLMDLSIEPTLAALRQGR